MLKKIGYKTYYGINASGEVSIIHHSTIIVKILGQGRFLLNTSGYPSYTTKARINKYSPAHIVQRNFTWYVTRQDSGKDVEFYDEIVVDARGQVIR